MSKYIQVREEGDELFFIELVDRTNGVSIEIGGGGTRDYMVGVALELNGFLQGLYCLEGFDAEIRILG